MVHFSLVFLIAFLINSAWALDKFWGQAYLGEVPFEMTQPVSSILVEKDKTFGQSKLLDDRKEAFYFWNLIWEDAPQWIDFIQDEFPKDAFCSNEDFSKHFDYMRFGYRLVSLSFILEALDHYERTLMSLGPKKHCFNSQEVLKSCKPQTQDMKNWINFLIQKNIFEKPIIPQGHSYQDFQKEFLIHFKDKSKRSTAQRRMFLKFEETSDLDHSVKNLTSVCDEDKRLFQIICSEEDHLFGQSQFELMTHILLRSNFTFGFNENYSAASCLKRFSIFQKSKEKEFPTLKVIMTSLYDNFQQRKDSFPLEGRAFVWGALKEFKDKGLVTLFEEPKAPEVKVSVMEPQVILKEKEVPQVAEKIPEKKEPKLVQPPPKKVPEKIKSAFLEASDLRRKNNYARVNVDMLRFKYDSVFSMSELILLEDSLKEYVQREALEEMKEFDHLGTLTGAIPLSFIKYMIDANHHQGLFNLVLVLGEKFWIQNDLDSIKEPEYIEFKNNSETQNQWLISIIAPD